MSDEREKLLEIMSSLEDDYKSGKISAEKYSYFRSKYEDKLNSIDAHEATRRIRSMQGKSSSNRNNRKRKKSPAKNKKKEEDLVQKYIINPKKDDVKYNKKKKSSMDGGTFKLLLLLVLVLGFTVGVGYGVFNLDFDAVSDTTPVAIVEDTAFPEFTQDIVENTTNQSSYNYTYDYSDYDDVETTEDSDYSADNSQDYQEDYQNDYQNDYQEDYGANSGNSSG